MLVVHNEKILDFNKYRYSLGDIQRLSSFLSENYVLRGVADLRYESSFVGFLKPRPKLTFGWVQGCHSYLDSATPEKANEIGIYKGIKIKIFLISSYQRPELITEN